MGAYHFHRVPTIISPTICDEELFFEFANYINYIMSVKIDHSELLEPQNTWNSAPAHVYILAAHSVLFCAKNRTANC